MRAVDRVLRGRDPAAATLDTIQTDSPLEPRDLALARNIAATTLRRRGALGDAIAACLDRPGLPKAGPIEAILLTAACQILLLDTPSHSAVDLAVRLANANPKTRHFRGLVNAVLRTLDRRKDALALPSVSTSDTPDWLAARWEAAYGPETVRAIQERHALPPPLDLTVKGDAEAWAERLGGIALPTGSIRLAARGRIDALQGYGDGAWWVQDAAASLPVQLLGNVAGQRVADLCAAPGGKTAQLAAAGADVAAVDRSAERLEILRANLKRLGLTAEIIEADLMTWTPAALFDAVLLDAPCSATGTIRRHPEIAWLRKPSDIDTLATLQRDLLNRVIDMLRPGGLVVYATCSLEPEEGEAQIARLLETRTGMKRVPITPDEIGGQSEMITADGDLRTLPSHLNITAPDGMDVPSGLDGFFAARLKRSG